MDGIKEWMEDWFDDSHFIHYHNRDDVRQFTDGFGDSPHHTGFYLSALILLGYFDNDDAQRFLNGLKLRTTSEGLARHPRNILDDGSLELCNRDQFTPLLFVIHHVNPALAAAIWEGNKSNLVLFFPNNRVHFSRARNKKSFYQFRLLGDFCELWDTLFDIFGSAGNGRDSSIIKSIYNCTIAKTRYPTFLTKLNWWMINKFLKPAEAFTRYFTHKHSGDDSPPPIHLAWIKLFSQK